jgi:hypothetical protein
MVNGQRMASLVLLEADRRQAIGDMAGAWECYRAIVRMATHTRRRGSLNQRDDLYIYWGRSLRERLSIWAADPRTSNPQLPGALEEALKSKPKPEWDSTSVTLYTVGPLAPAGARALSPTQVASWLVTTNDAKLRIIVANSIAWPWSPDRLQDRRDYHDLVVMLAGELYRREHGAFPPAEEALVGTYLKSVPDNGATELYDEMPPIVE